MIDLYELDTLPPRRNHAFQWKPEKKTVPLGEKQVMFQRFKSKGNFVTIEFVDSEANPQCLRMLKSF